MSSPLELDLAWLAAATPLMSDAYWSKHGTRAAPMIPATPPTPKEDVEPSRRVGRWFEYVHLSYLRSAPGVEILAANTTVRASGRTLGELDILYRRGEHIVHREVAVKYFLAAKEGQDPAAWVGPGRRDRLSIKLHRLATHQTTIATQARDAGAWPGELPFPDVTEVLLLGALFSPPEEPRLPIGANASADQGHWYYASDFAKRFATQRWCVLDKPWWLSPEHARGRATMPAEVLARDLRGPRFVAHTSSTEVVRAFVVPDGWWAEIE